MALAAALSIRVGCSSCSSTYQCLNSDRVPQIRTKRFSAEAESFKRGHRVHPIASPLWRYLGKVNRGFRLSCEMRANLGDTSLHEKSANPIDGGDRLLGKDYNIQGHDNGDSNAVHPESSGGNGESPPGDGNGGNGGGGNDGGSGKDGDDAGEEAAKILKYEDVMKQAESRGIKLPSDMCEVAKTVGIEKELFDNYLNLQELAWPLGAAIRWIPLLRDRMLVDRQFLFKIGAEIVIDSCCATVAEVQKRGKDFWAEFELYAADLLVGVVVNVALVGLLAPYARIGQPPASKGFFAGVARYYDSLPSSVFEAERPGCSFSVQQRAGSYFVKGILYATVGFACGLVGQGIANLIMTAKRSVKKSEDDVPVPPLIKSAALWGIFLAVSSNTRYQIVNALERMVESTAAAKSAPVLAMGFTVGIRLANNVYGGMQFVDWARWSGCQ